jgi:cell division protease FtsH
MNNKIEGFEEKIRILENARNELKKHFNCLDEIIDRMIDSIRLWYVDPTLLERAPIINLWGATGTGKSDLIKRLVSLLGLDNQFFHVSMNSVDEQFVMSTFQGTLFKKTDVRKPRNVIFLDEFQWFKTKNMDGESIKSKTFNDIWDFISEREIRKETVYKDINDIVRAVAYYQECGSRWGMSAVYKPKNKSLKRSIEDAKKECVFLCDLLEMNEIEYLHKAVFPDMQISKLAFMKLDKFSEAFKKKSEDNLVWQNINCRQYLIIVAGNLDNAYSFCGSTMYDIDADFFHTLSKRLNIGDIKESLQEFFRDEHISRLGNNHLIFPTINKAGYEAIITRYSGMQLKSIKEKHGISVNLSDEVYKMLYQNSVYPTQGTRPVFSTINDFFNSVVGHFTLHAITKRKNNVTIDYDYNTHNTVGQFAGEQIFVPYTGDIDKIKEDENKKTNQKLMCSAHEAGHCIVYSILNGYVPNKVVVSTSTHYGGFMFDGKEKVTFKQYENDIMVGFAGIEAEKLVFGDTNVSTGSSSDISGSTSAIAFLLRNSGILNNTEIALETSNGAENCDTDFYKTNTVMQKMAKKYRKMTAELLKKNLPVLVELTDALFKTNILDGCLVQEFFKKFNMNFDVKPYASIEDPFCDQRIVVAFEALKSKIQSKEGKT